MEELSSDEKLDIVLVCKAFETSVDQLAIIESHITRIVEKRDRYAVATIPYVCANMEVTMWTQIRELLKANLTGRVVQPS